MLHRNGMFGMFAGPDAQHISNTAPEQDQEQEHSVSGCLASVALINSMVICAVPTRPRVWWCLVVSVFVSVCVCECARVCVMV